MTDPGACAVNSRVKEPSGASTEATEMFEFPRRTIHASASIGEMGAASSSTVTDELFGSAALPPSDSRQIAAARNLPAGTRFMGT